MPDPTDPLAMPLSVEKFDVDPSYFDNQRVRALTDKELDWLDVCQNAGKHLLSKYQLSSDGGFSLIMLDQALSCWRSDSSTDRPDDEYVAKALGALFAFFLRHTFKGIFVIVIDQHGSYFGVQTEQGDIGYPIDSVRKRLHEPQATLVDLVVMISQYHDESAS